MHIYCNRCGLASKDDALFCQGCGASFQTRSAVPVPTIVAATVHYGGFWIRVVSAFMDTFLLFAAIIPVRMFLGSAVVLFGVNADLTTHETMVARRVIRIAIGIALAFAYKAGMESSAYQATLGKLAVRLKVTDQEGRRISFARATARYFSKMLSAFALGLGYVMVGFDEQKQGLHDRIAGTLVMYRDSGTLRFPVFTTGSNAHPG